MAANKKAKSSDSGTGLAPNTAAALSYVLGPVTGVVFLILEKDDLVRFHAMQSIVVFGGLFVVQWIVGVTVVLVPLVPVLSILGFVLWLVLIYKAYQSEKWEVPFIGKFVHQLLEKV